MSKLAQPSEGQKVQPPLDNRLKKFQSFGSSTSLLDENYFKEDTASGEILLQKRAENDINMIKNYFIKFRIGQSAESFAWHFLYFYLFGPLLIPILRLRGPALPRNYLFVGSSYYVYQQLIVFLSNVSCLTLFYVLDNPNVSGIVEILNNAACVAFRCVIICVKYGTFDPLKIKILRETPIADNLIINDFLLTKWSEQDLTVSRATL